MPTIAASRPPAGSTNLAGVVDRWPPEVLLVLALGMAALAWAPLNTDSGYIIVAGRRLLAGDRLYVDMMETNPPMIFWLMAAVAFVGRHLALSDTRAVGLFAALVLGAAGASSVRAFVPGTPRLMRLGVLVAFTAAVVVPYLIWVGQREQIAAMLTLPYVLLAARAPAGPGSSRSFAIWCGMLAAIGFAIKPFFLAAWIAVELVVLARTRRLPGVARLEFWTVLAGQGLFVALVLTLTPEYLTRAVPLARATYDAYGRGRLTTLETMPVAVLGLAGAAALAAPLLLRPRANIEYTRVFGAATLGWLLSYVVQGKGWYYHLLPAVVYGTTAITLLALDTSAALQAFKLAPMRQRLGAATCALLIASGALYGAPEVARLCRDDAVLLSEQQPKVVIGMAEFIEQVAGGEPVYFLSTSMWPAFPIVNLSGARWPYHYHFLWPIPSLYAKAPPGGFTYREPAAQGSLEHEFFTTVINDLRRWPPRVLVVDGRADQQAMRGRTFDFVKYFSGSPDFRAFMRGYRRLADVGPWELYERR